MADRWPEIKALFDGAVDVDDAERDAWLAGATDDQSLIDEVRSLLRYDDDGAEVLDLDASRRIGTRLGAYELKEIAGSGGMGTVYRAERCDDEFRKRVAVKLVKPGMDSEHVLQRFRQERQVLANLEHPGIARLIDGGMTDDGRPYLVMEYVDGMPIDAWCETQDLSVDERLELFRSVCAAVQHAHQNLVVHRDLKPGNIVVNADGEVKLLDFGISKVLAQEDGARGATLTQADIAPMTPRYASPEQVRGEAITTATDVYALGVLLYEMLTGRRPYEFTTHTRSEIERLVCDTDPARPSAIAEPPLRRRLSGDLDTIVMKAMHKDPARRYASVDQLAEDIRRHTVGLPVLARPDTFGYRLNRFARRHRVAVAAGAAVLVVLVAGFVVSTVLFFQARTAEREANRRFGQVRDFARTIMYDVYDEVEKLSGATPVRASLVETTLEYLDALAEDAGTDAGLHQELADGYSRMTAVLGLDTSGNLGDVEGAVGSARKSLHHRKQVVAVSPGNLDARLRLASAHRSLADTLVKLGQPDEARRNYEESEREARDVMAEAPDETDARRAVVVVAMKLGDLLERQGDIDRARIEYAEAVTETEALASGHPENLEFQRDSALALGRMGLFEVQHGDLEAGRPHLERMLENSLTLAQAHPENAQLQRDLGIAYERMGDLELGAKNVDAALRHYDAQLSLFRAQIEADPQSASIKQNLSIAIEKHATVNMSLERFAEARAGYEQSLALTSSLSEADPSNVTTRYYVSICHYHVAQANRAMGELDAAETSYRAMTDICRALHADDPESATFFIAYATGAVERAQARLMQGRHDDAMTIVDEALRIAGDMRERYPDRGWAQAQFASCRRTQGLVHEQRGADETRPAETRLADLHAAVECYERSREAGDAAPEGLDADIDRCREMIAALGGED